jgi:hypothetical protein
MEDSSFHNIQKFHTFAVLHINISETAGLLNCFWQSPAQFRVPYSAVSRLWKPSYHSLILKCTVQCSTVRIAAGPRQDSYSWFRVPLGRWPYFNSFHTFTYFEMGPPFLKKRPHFNIQEFSTYHTGNISSQLFMKVIAFYYNNRMDHLNALCGQNSVLICQCLWLK